MHSGAHAGATHRSAWQRREPQSAFAPQGASSGHDGAHAGDAHDPAVHTPEAQSELAWQGLPSGQLGAHVDGVTGVTQTPPVHEPDAQSAPELQASPSLQVGAQPLSGEQTPPSQVAGGGQPDFVVHAAVASQSIEHAGGPSGDPE